MRAKGINFCRSFAGGTIAWSLLQKLLLLLLVVVVAMVLVVETGVDGSLTSSVETAIVSSDMRSAATEEENDLMGSTVPVGNGGNGFGCGSGYGWWWWWFQIPRVVVTTEPP